MERYARGTARPLRTKRRRVAAKLKAEVPQLDNWRNTLPPDDVAGLRGLSPGWKNAIMCALQFSVDSNDSRRKIRIAGSVPDLQQLSNVFGDLGQLRLSETTFPMTRGAQTESQAQITLRSVPEAPSRRGPMLLRWLVGWRGGSARLGLWEIEEAFQPSSFYWCLPHSYWTDFAEFVNCVASSATEGGHTYLEHPYHSDAVVIVRYDPNA